MCPPAVPIHVFIRLFQNMYQCLSSSPCPSAAAAAAAANATISCGLSSSALGHTRLFHPFDEIYRVLHF